MRVLPLVFSAFCLVACDGRTGERGPSGATGASGETCITEEVDGGAIITCGETQSFVRDGVDGKDGQSIKGDKGDKGEIGPQGIQGIAGLDGQSCTVTSVPNGAEVSCGGAKVTVFNGLNGSDGMDGMDGMDGVDGVDGIDAESVSVIDPCPTISTTYPELMLKIGDKYVAYFQNGSQEFLTVLKPGVSYKTTDGRNCLFKVP